MDTRDRIILTSKDKIAPKHKAEHEPFEYFKYEVTERNPGNQCYVCLYEIPPQKTPYPYHYHAANTEVFYIISGSGMLETPDGAKSITAGDVIVCAPGASGAHKIINTSETDTLTYFECDSANSPDVVFYPKTGKIGAIIQGRPNTFFDESTAVDYYKGE